MSRITPAVAVSFPGRSCRANELRQWDRPPFRMEDRIARLATTVLVSVTFGCFLLTQFILELNPYAGTWEPVHAYEIGNPMNKESFFRTWLKVDSSGDATLASYWSCGVRCSTFGEGKMVREKGRFALYRESWATGEREPYANAYLDILPDKRLGFTTAAGGKAYYLELERTENAETIFDAIGWH
ncbi:MAG: hypothetical protein ABL962_08570 [Fimbriimonadaceae bacterium]